MLTGAYTNNLFTEEQRFDVVRNAYPGAGACGGMYTANTMASSIEALGMSLPYSSSIPAVDPLKRMECAQAGRYVIFKCAGAASFVQSCSKLSSKPVLAYGYTAFSAPRCTHVLSR